MSSEMDHERIDELLAGYALRSLSEADALEADRLLSEHVPTCDRCRATLEAFTEVEGELAMAARPVRAPDVLLPRLRHAIAGQRPAQRRRRFIAWTTAAGAAAAVIGLISWSALLDTRLSAAVDKQRKAIEAGAAMADPQTTKIRLTKFVERPSHVEAAYYQHEARMYLVGTNVPPPAPGHVYRVWLLGADGHARVAADFLPDEVGVVILVLSVDPSRYSTLEITEERVGAPGPGPRGQERWAASLTGGTP
jgi:hypothetical protein